MDLNHAAAIVKRLNARLGGPWGIKSYLKKREGSGVENGVFRALAGVTCCVIASRSPGVLTWVLVNYQGNLKKCWRVSCYAGLLVASSSAMKTRVNMIKIL